VVREEERTGGARAEEIKTPQVLFGKYRIEVEGRGLKRILGNFEL
jgi:hypothetical protein